MRRPRASASAALAAAVLACSAPGSAPPGQDQKSLPGLGLMGTVPVYWGESASLGSLLADHGERHWARPVLEKHFRLAPVDALDQASLSGLRYLLMAQPRALAPAENVALDAWVRGGGKLLLLADPQMTGRTRYPLGDKRRPQDVALLSPILSHWGLALEYVELQSEGYRTLDSGALGLPVNLPGRFVASVRNGPCVVTASGVVARCAIGRGQAVLVADAAVLDLQAPQAAARPALDMLLGQAFGKLGYRAGRPR
ncbi:MAG: ABC transporter [Croceibacterium sp.]